MLIYFSMGRIFCYPWPELEFRLRLLLCYLMIKGLWYMEDL
jgi:hypothetical protein